MKRKLMHNNILLTLSCLILVCLVLGSATISGIAGAEDKHKKKALIVTGIDYPGHKWKQTAPVLKKLLAKDSRFSVDVNEDPASLASPLIHDYDVIVLHFMDWKKPDPGTKARANLKKFVAGGKGLVVVHFACGAFQEWPEYVKLTGRVWDPKLRGHDPHGSFKVEFTAKGKTHSATKGIKDFSTTDELYTCLAGTTPIEVLATATSKVDKKKYPMAFVLPYGKGRVFNCPLGHDVRAFSSPAVGELFRRGMAWTAGLGGASK